MQSTEISQINQWSTLDQSDILPLPKQVEHSQQKKVDPRLLNLSYSSLLTAHSCPRKFQLDKLGSISEVPESLSESITFSYGHVVGLGIQMALERKDLEDILWEMSLQWK